MRLGFPGCIIILDLILGLGLGFGLVVVLIVVVLLFLGLGLGFGLVVVVIVGFFGLVGDLILPAQILWVASQILLIVSRVGAVSW